MERHVEGIGGNTHAILSLMSQNPLVASLITFAVVLVASLLLFRVPASQGRHGGTQAPSMPGYWLPFVGHGPHFMFNKDGFLAGLRTKYPEGIFSLLMLGQKHHIIHEPALSTALMNRPRTTAEEKWIATRMLTTSFGLRKQDQLAYSNLAHETPDLFKHMLSEPGLSNLVNSLVDQVRTHISEFVTFNSSNADQADWERTANVDVVENSKGEPFVEADLMSLVRGFVSSTANPALFGTNFVDNFPDFWDLLWIFDEGLVLLAAKVPAWIPWPRLQRAKVARRQMLTRTLEFEAAMEKYLEGEDPGIKWQDMDNVSTFVKRRIELFRNHGLSLEARASCDVALAWAMNANANPLITWMIFELYRDPVLLEIVREEIAPYVKVVQPRNEFGSVVWLAPELEELDLNGLIRKCPHLKAAYCETLRVYTGIWTVKWLTEDVVLERKGQQSETYFLQKGHMAHIAHELHQFDAEYFPNPKEWHHDRFLKETEDENGRKLQTADFGTFRPFGGGFTMCKGRAFALREMLLYVSMIISYYDMVPPEGAGWDEPATCKRAASRYPTKPIKVWIKRRDITSELSEEQRG
ncbi:hypothetical protein QQS21_003299 [Conoideocrella luteorostrata]|uniref:Cytochrome P450 n=1 Tax=Conoideocrella luteorostrata TaxID=1105319 RepID=A0AAJ0CTF6_9HYPO|nr:hypothetical protein QQS21_003299 [Conoideocrella luteorostrata]